MNLIFHARQFFINSRHILDILGAKKLKDFLPSFHPYFTVRPTFEGYNYPLKVLTQSSMVEYLRIPKKPPPNHFWQKKFQPQNPKSHSQPSVHWFFQEKEV